MSLLTIVTITYNDRSNLENTIKSVVDQKEKKGNIQYVIIDNLSTDGTRDVIDKYSCYIDVFISEKDLGIFNAMNKGLKIATGDSILFLNSGDIFYKKFNIYEFQNKYDIKNFTIFTKTLQEYNGIYFLRPKKDKLKYSYFNFGHQGCFVPKKMYKNILYDERFSISADSIWMKNIWKNQDFIISNEISSIFALSGLSNNFNLKYLLMYNKQPIKYTERLKSILKVIFFMFLPKHIAYRMLYYNKYDLYKL